MVQVFESYLKVAVLKEKSALIKEREDNKEEVKHHLPGDSVFADVPESLLSEHQRTKKAPEEEITENAESAANEGIKKVAYPLANIKTQAQAAIGKIGKIEKSEQMSRNSGINDKFKTE